MSSKTFFWAFSEMATLAKTSNDLKYIERHFCGNNVATISPMEKRFVALDSSTKSGLKWILMAFLVNPHRPPPRHDVGVGTSDTAKRGGWVFILKIANIYCSMRHPIGDVRLRRRCAMRWELKLIYFLPRSPAQQNVSSSKVSLRR